MFTVFTTRARVRWNFWFFAPINFSLHQLSCLVGQNELNQSHPYCKHCLVPQPMLRRSMLTKLCASYYVSRHCHQYRNRWKHNRNEKYLEPRNRRVAWAKSKSREEGFQFKELWDLGVREKIESRRESNNLRIIVYRSNNLNPSTSIQIQRLKNVMRAFKTMVSNK